MAEKTADPRLIQIKRRVLSTRKSVKDNEKDIADLAARVDTIETRHHIIIVIVGALFLLSRRLDDLEARIEVLEQA
jgi:hypothetical protein